MQTSPCKSLRNERPVGAFTGRKPVRDDLGVKLMQIAIRTVLIAVTAASAIFPWRTIAAGTTPNLRGTIENVSGDTIQVKESNGTSVTVRLAQNIKIASVAKATLADVKPGTFIGTAARPQPDGRLQAIEIHIFPESMRGTGEGNRAWDAGPGSSMTN